MVMLVRGMGGGRGGGKGGDGSGAALLEGTAVRAGGQGLESDQSEEMLPAGEEWEGDAVGGTAGGGHARKGAGRVGAAWGGGTNKASGGTMVGGNGKRGGGKVGSAVSVRRGLRLRPPQSTDPWLSVGV